MLSPATINSPQPITEREVAPAHVLPGRSPRTKKPITPARIGELPIPTIVPTATPVLATPAKNSIWYAAMLAPAIKSRHQRPAACPAERATQKSNDQQDQAAKQQANCTDTGRLRSRWSQSLGCACGSPQNCSSQYQPGTPHLGRLGAQPRTKLNCWLEMPETCICDL